jgi:transposase
MPFDLLESESWQIIAIKNQGLSYRNVRRHFNGKHGLSQIYNVCKYYREYGEAPKYKQHTRRKKTKERMLDELATKRLELIFEEDPCLYLDEARVQLNRKYGYSYTDYAVDQALKKVGLTLKAVQFHRIQSVH